MQSLETCNAYENFISACDCDATKQCYANALKIYLKFHNLTQDSLLQIDKQTTSEMIRKFVMYQRNVRKNSLSRINVCFSALKLFYEMNDYDLNWSRLAKYKGKERRKMVQDRTYTKEEIQRMLEFSDLRMKVVILVMLSSGIRVGGLACLRLRDLTYIEKYKLYSIVVYSDSPNDTYYTFCTPEAATTIRMYLDSRQNQYGETLTPDSPLIRQKFDSKKKIEMTSDDIQERMRYLLIKTGISPARILRRDNPDQKLLSEEEITERKRKRHEVMRCHGLRKYFDTVCIDSDMKNIPKELLMGHKMNLGMDRHYYRPTSDKLLTEYLKVVDDLTINDENRLKRENQQLKSELDETFSVFASQLQDVKKKLGL